MLLLDSRELGTTLALAQEHAPLPVTSDLAPAQLLLAQRDAFAALARDRKSVV